MPLKLLVIVSNSKIEPTVQQNNDIDIYIDDKLSDKNRMYASIRKTYAYFLFIDRDIKFVNDAEWSKKITKQLREERPAILNISDDVKIYHRSVIHYFFLTIPYQVFHVKDVNFVLTYLEEPFKPFIKNYDAVGSAVGDVILGEHNIYVEEELMKWEKTVSKVGDPKSWINRARKYINRIPTGHNTEHNVCAINFLKLVNLHSYFDMEHAYFKKKKIAFHGTSREIYGEIGLFHFAHDFLNASRNKIINHLITVNKYRSYVEIGVYNCYHFDEVMIEYKIGVDPKPDFNNDVYKKWRSKIMLMTSDDFFRNLPPETRYDIIFIDGCLMEENVSRDIYNALEHITDNGVVVMHDCNPPHEFYQRDNIEGKYKKNKKAKILWNGKEYLDRYWNGKTWKAIARMQLMDSNLEIYTVDTDWGMGIIRKRKTQLLKIPGIDANRIRYDTLVKYRRQLLNLITVDEFLKLFPF